MTDSHFDLTEPRENQTLKLGKAGPKGRLTDFGTSGISSKTSLIEN
jgi:hypothetical protein